MLFLFVVRNTQRSWKNVCTTIVVVVAAETKMPALRSQKWWMTQKTLLSTRRTLLMRTVSASVLRARVFNHRDNLHDSGDDDVPRSREEFVKFSSHTEYSNGMWGCVAVYSGAPHAATKREKRLQQMKKIKYRRLTSFERRERERATNNKRCASGRDHAAVNDEKLTCCALNRCKPFFWMITK